MTVLIPIKDNPNHSLVIALDNVNYEISFLYNAGQDSWSMDIALEDKTPVINGIKLVPNFPLLKNLPRDFLPPGEIFCQVAQKNFSIGRTAFTNNDAQIIYFTEAEIETL